MEMEMRTEMKNRRMAEMILTEVNASMVAAQTAVTEARLIAMEDREMMKEVEIAAHAGMRVQDVKMQVAMLAAVELMLLVTLVETRMLVEARTEAHRPAVQRKLAEKELAPAKRLGASSMMQIAIQPAAVSTELNRLTVKIAAILWMMTAMEW